MLVQSKGVFVSEQDSAPSKSLLHRRGTLDGNTLDWGCANGTGAAVTAEDCAAVRTYTGAKGVNLARLSRIKAALLEGKTPVQIHRQLRAMGRGYGLSTIKHECAALTPLLEPKK